MELADSIAAVGYVSVRGLQYNTNCSGLFVFFSGLCYYGLRHSDFHREKVPLER